MTTRGFNETDFYEIGVIISEALNNYTDEKIMKKIKQKTLNMTKKYPLFY